MFHSLLRQVGMVSPWVHVLRTTLVAQLLEKYLQPKRGRWLPCRKFAGCYTIRCKVVGILHTVPSFRVLHSMFHLEGGPYKCFKS